MRRNHVKAELKKGHACFGTLLNIGHCGLIEILGYTGFDFIFIDMEHSPFSHETVEGFVRTADLVGLTSLVRVPKCDDSLIGLALESGAGGVIIPHVNSRKMAMQAVKAAKFSPKGTRGQAPMTRAAQYGAVALQEHLRTSNRETMVVPIIEDEEGVNHAEEILSVEGIDAFFLGHHDLAQSMGLAGQPFHPRVLKETEKVIKVAQKIGKARPGVVLGELGTARRWIKLGVRLIAYQTDNLIFLGACKHAIAELRSQDNR